MGFLDKAKEMAAKADQALANFDGAPNPAKQTDALISELGALVFAREQGRSDESFGANFERIVAQLRDLEAQVGAHAMNPSAPPPPPGAAAQMAAQTAAPPAPGQAPPPPPGAGSPPPPPPPPPAPGFDQVTPPPPPSA